MARSDQTCGFPTMCEWESPDYEPILPVSEKSNPLTRNIDRASADCIVRTLQACDAQMFQEETEASYKRLLSDQVVKTVMEVAKRLELILQDPQDSLVVLSGCGTSGRLAFLMASSFNRELRKLNQSSVYSYIIAGGDRALLTSQEAPEDDPKSGVLCLKKVCEGKKQVLFIGISCGLSAPFVAGQLDHCLQHPEVYTPVLVGFNPAHQAKDGPIPGCTFTFHSVVQRMQELAKSQAAFLINPTVGPEAISGSSRMKGGSATKILLDVVLSSAHAAAFTKTPVTYNLQCGRRVCYLGWGCLAVLGLIDASECDPTFGADDVSEVVNLAHRVREKMSNLHAVYHHTDGDGAAAQQQWELSTKLVLNAVSTGAHILKGKVYQNHMIDVQVTNSKLYRRATHLLQKLSGHPESKCEEALLKAIYRVDKLTVDITSSDMTTHTLTARNRTKVVPLALVCLLTGGSLSEAEAHLELQPIIREAEPGRDSREVLVCWWRRAPFSFLLPSSSSSSSGLNSSTASSTTSSSPSPPSCSPAVPAPSHPDSPALVSPEHLLLASESSASASSPSVTETTGVAPWS
ncbi:hypothetical protein INR49_032389 [Caranx melampygus]|nr:hypothetical protein INR49_032389 [Caranx melampygus]